MNHARHRSRAAAVGLIAAGLMLGSTPSTYAAAPGTKHLPQRPGIAKIFPNLADADVHRFQSDHIAVPEAKCDIYGRHAPVTWASTLSLSDAGPGTDVRIEVAKMPTKKAARHAFKGHALLSTCKRVNDGGDIYRIRPVTLPKVGKDRVGLAARTTSAGDSVIEHVSLAVVRKGKKVVIATAGRSDAKIPEQRLRRLAKLVAHRL